MTGKFKAKIYLLLLLVTAVLLSSCSGIDKLFDLLDPEEVMEWTTEDAFEQEPEDLGMEKMKEVASLGDLKLYFNELTGEIAVKQGASVWRSNPENRLDMSSESIDKLSSVLLVNTIDASETPKQMTSFGDSAKYGQFESEKIENGIRVEYRFGRITRIPLYPQVFTAERFEELILDLEPAEQKNMRRYYLEVNYETVTDKQALETLTERYEKFEEVGHIFTLKQSPSPLETRRITEYLERLSYTRDDRDFDHDSVGYTDPVKYLGNFVLTVEFTLEDGKMRVKIPASKIRATDNITPDSLILLPYFNSAEGYDKSVAVMPDGSGALYDLGKIRSANTVHYEEPVYGRDFALFKSTQTAEKKNLSFPVYGLMTENSAMYAEIKESDATALLYASPTLSKGEPGSVGFKFKLIEYAGVKLVPSDPQTVNSYAEHALQEDIIVDYKFLNGGGDWPDIAKSYKDELSDRGILKDFEEKEVPLFANLVGAIDDIKPILGVPSEYIKPLTDFAQAGEIAGDLKEIFDKNTIVLRYSGWRKGGVKSRLASFYDPEGKLGSKKQFLELTRSLADMKIVFAPDLDLQYVYRNVGFDGFNMNRDSVRFITSEAAYKPLYNPASFMVDGSKLYGYILSPNLLPKYAANTADLYSVKELAALSVPYLASDLSSNFSKRQYYNRNRAIDFSVEAAKLIDDKDLDLVSHGANAYMLENLKYTAGIPFHANPHPLLDVSVPFVQMVLSGKIRYAAESFNDSSDRDLYVLKCIETGSGMYFSAMYEDNSVLKDTAYDNFMTLNYETLKTPLTEAGRQIEKALSAVYGHEMVDYKILDKGIRAVMYDNGKGILVNYGDGEADSEYGSVPAFGWKHFEWR